MTRWTRCEACRKSTRKRYARFCDVCRWPLRLKRKKYQWTTEKDAFLRAKYDSAVKGRAAKIGALWGWPRWVIAKRAAVLGVTRMTTLTALRPWTPQEIRLLERYAGVRHPEWLCRKLHRSMTSVQVKMKRLRLSRLPEGYSETQVAEAFGVDRSTVENWLRRGWLRSSFVPAKGQPHRITDADLLAFIREYRHAFELRKVSQDWFLDLVLGGAIETRSAA